MLSVVFCFHVYFNVLHVILEVTHLSVFPPTYTPDETDRDRLVMSYTCVRVCCVRCVCCFNAVQIKVYCI